MKRPAASAARAAKRPAAAVRGARKVAIAQRPAAAFKLSPEPKRGKARTQGSKGKEKGTVSYVRTINGTKKTRKERNAWCRNFDSSNTGNESELVDLLIKDGNCGEQVRPTHCHPMFAGGWGKETLSLKDKCRVMFGILTGMTTAQVHQHYGTNHKMIEAMTRNLDLAREQYTRVDVEADESAFASAAPEDEEMKERGQWAGVVQRGEPETLALFRTESDRATKKAPGPGAINNTDWEPFLLDRPKDREVILHSDGARSYRMKAPGMFHDSVSHCEKRGKRGGEWVRAKPVHSKIAKHKTPSGTALKVKAGTRIIDRARKHVKHHIGHRIYKPHSRAIAARIRSAQWEHWHRGHDLRSATGEMPRDSTGSALTAGGATSMGEIVSGDASATDQNANARLRMAAAQSYRKLDKPERFQSDPPPAAFDLRDVPLQCADSAASLKHAVDWVTLEDGAAEQLDTVDAHDATRAGNYTALPAPFKPSKDPGEIAFTTQLYILHKDANGEQHALKHARFDSKVRADIAEDVFANGRAPAVHWGGSADIKTPLELFYCAMDRLGEEKRRAGNRIIEEFGPRANNRNQFAEWTSGKINDEHSPIFGWQAAEVKESLRNCARGSVGAGALERWAVALKRIHPFALDNVAAPILKSHDVHGAMWIGKARVGKSTASKTIGFAISAYQIDKNGRADFRPSAATTKEIDFLRLEPGTAFKPAIADDAALTKWTPDETKAFLDPAEEVALSRARWGGASFEQNQPRQICANPRDEKFEKKVRSIRGGKEEIKFDDFFKTIDCNFAGDKQSGYHVADVEDQTFAPPGYDIHMKWAVAAMRKLARGYDAGRSNAIRGPTLFNQGAPPRRNFPGMGGDTDVGADAPAAASAAVAPAPAPPVNPDDDDDDIGLGGGMGGAADAGGEPDVFGFGGGMDGDDGPSDAAAAAAPPAPAAPIKRGTGAFRFCLEKPQGPIDLSTPTPKKKRMTLDEELSQMTGEGEVAGAAAASSSDVAPA
ncbi:unnamed protein product [Prorocentrum cordatum]|uniref:Uncharacterized protein n=1 Tax=Prorocentrum cordatum TaxID=2364126 RepID=A0ABN9V2V4_9DINO|nr:unnamed protein product [Polarella glacialis]